MDNMKITLDIIKNIYHNLSLSTEGFEGIKDENQIERIIEDASLIESPRDLASYYLYNIINKRPFIDKNKAMGILLFELILIDSGKEIEFTDKELYNLIKQIQDSSLTISDIVKFIEKKEEAL